MTYAETLAYLYAQLPMFQRIGAAAYKADLSNTHALMRALGHPEHGLRCVHVAGTNGKGSTCSLVASVLQEAGYRVGLHTSPHLKDFRERFRINGEMVAQETVVRFVDSYGAAFESIGPSFFEWGVAFALWWFREEKVDIAVIETGMGGRLDSTNVITPDVSVITNIGWDHMQFLGGTLEAIAQEKAGIIKPGVPVVIGESQVAVADVFRSAAAAVNAPLSFADATMPDTFTSTLAGAHQRKNALTAFAAVHQLRKGGCRIDNHAIIHGFLNVVRNTGLRGRWEVLVPEPLVIADVAHNVDGFRVINEMVSVTPHDQLHIVLGMVADKDIAPALAILPQNATYYFCKADIPRALDANELATEAARIGLHGKAFGPVAKAFSAAQLAAGPGDLVLVTGSVFVVAEVL
ncbi:MAG: bifunctional folylpolyglutamate synthase/dihydrofolate synthase [Flavobacteriales bacterium]|nr:bifunctional folylpolyglutamate synthase/dihydrofolate synthase [Flavobacteriales bacterium]